MPKDQVEAAKLRPLPYADGSIGERKAHAYRRRQLQVRVLALAILLGVAAIIFGVRWLVERL